MPVRVKQSDAEVQEFIRKELWDGEKLWRSYRGKRGDAPGFAADHAFLISGLIEMHGADGDPAWLAWARELQSALDEGHWDESRAGYVIRTEVGTQYRPIELPEQATACQLWPGVPGTNVAVRNCAVGTTQLTSPTSVEPIIGAPLVP